MPILKIYLVRHGETDANRQGILQGQLDTELNELGQKQARLVAERLRSVIFDLAFSSDLSRAAKTAETILSYHPDIVPLKQEELRERFMGDLQGRKMTPVHKYTANDTEERPDKFINRIASWWNACVLQHSITLPPKPDGSPYTILVVSHGGVIGTLVRVLIRQQALSCAKGVFVLTCPNTSVSIIEVGEDGKGVITAYGDVSHLEGMSEVENVDEIGLRN